MRTFSPRNFAAGVVAVAGVVLSLGLYLPVLPWWLVITAVILFASGGVFWLVDRVFASRHRREFTEFAALHGWEYVPSTREYSARFASFPFATGTRQRQEHVLRGMLNGVQCVTFTHHFEIRDDNNRGADQAFQVSLVEIPVVLPRLEVVPEGVAAKFSKALGGRDLDVESHEFNRRWRVLCRDARYAHAVLDPRMVERLLEPDALELAIRIDGGAVLAWQAGRVGTGDLARRLGVLTAVARRIPAHVVREYQEQGAHNYSGRERPIPDTAPGWATTPGALTGGKATGIEPGPPATGEGYGGQPFGDPRGTFDIFLPNRSWLDG